VRLFEQIQNFAEDLNRVVEERTFELEQERDRIDTLYHITSELAQTLDMDRLLSRALGMVANAVKADDGAIMRIDPLTDTLYSQAVLNPQSPQEGGLKPTAVPGDGQHPHHPAEELAAWLIENEQVVVVEDLHQAPYWDKDAPGASEWRSALGVVLETNEDITGRHGAPQRQVGMFTEDQLRLLAAAASQVAAAINNADLYGLIRDQAERLGTLCGRAGKAEKNRYSRRHRGWVILADADSVVILVQPRRRTHLPAA
jgi:GAF domain-containing protein